ncbi:MAG TPA: hypothetical protein VEG38_23200 [Acidimicrobiia bacterium]|nr:hypothetical protein [Acidimicrobiia bacterium]
MNRLVRLAIGLAGLPLAGSIPAADATGAAVCTITGTITFSSTAADATQGVWQIDPAVIECQGLFNGYDRIVGPGRFSGTGSYTALPGGTGPCLRNIGSGTVDYTFPTSASDVHLVERQDYTLAGVGTFATPSLRGTFQVTPPYEGDCVTKPITKALFVSQATLVRFVPPDPERYNPSGL